MPGGGRARPSIKLLKETTKLHEAAKGSGELNNLEKQIELIHAIDEEGQTALFVAAKQGHAKNVQSLIQAGSDIEARSATGQTPLIVAAEDGQADVVRLLVRNGADTRAKDRAGNTALHHAVTHQNIEITKALLAVKDVGVDEANAEGWLPLHLACQGEAQAFVECLLALGEKAGVNTKGSEGQTALLLAAEKGWIPVVEALMKAGADVKIASADGETALIAAVRGGNLQVVRAIIKSKPDIDAVGRDGQTALIAAAEEGQTEIFDVLSKLGAKVDVRDARGKSALDHACEHGQLAMVQALVASPAVAQDLKAGGTGALLAASWGVAENSLEIVELLLKAGASPAPPGNLATVETPLAAAVAIGNVPVAQALLKAGAKPEGRCDDGATVLQRAFANGHPTMILDLLKCGADVKVTVGPRRTPLLLFSIESGWVEVADQLIERGESISRDDPRWTTSLTDAIRDKRNNPVVKLLLDAGAPPGSLLPMAMREAGPLVAEMFLRAGAEPDAACVNLALDLKNQELLTLVLSYGAPATDEALARAIKDGNGPAVAALLRAGAKWGDIGELEPLARVSTDLQKILKVIKREGVSDELKRKCLMLKMLTVRTPLDGATALAPTMRNAIAIGKRISRVKPGT
jgi:ankyrin repeat protein